MATGVTLHSLVAVVLLGASVVPAAFAKTEQRNVDLKDKDGKCGHDVTPDDVHLKKHNNDKLEWTVTNMCTTDQPVLFCVYLNSNVKNPFKPCHGNPAADIGTPFTVAGNGGVRVITCHPDPHATEAHYEKQVLVGTEVPSNGCPQHPLAAATVPHHGPRHATAAPRARGGLDVWFTHILDISIEQ